MTTNIFDETFAIEITKEGITRLLVGRQIPPAVAQARTLDELRQACSEEGDVALAHSKRLPPGSRKEDCSRMMNAMMSGTHTAKRFMEDRSRHENLYGGTSRR